MSSTFVPSVEPVALPRSRGGRPRRNGEHKSVAAAATAAARPAPAPTYHLGKRGSTALKLSRSKWTWEWLAVDAGESSLATCEDSRADKQVRC
jgi:hypothetical protein